MPVPPNPLNQFVKWVGDTDQQLRNARAKGNFTWDNFRYENLASHSTYAAGVARIPFNPVFDNACFIVVANGNTAGPWYTNVTSSDRTGFLINVHDSAQANYSGSFQVSYIALGF